jgi:hypothetical protein
MVSTGVATSTIRSKVEQKRSMEVQSLRNLIILLSRSLCCVVKWLALLDVKNIGLKIAYLTPQSVCRYSNVTLPR